MHLSYVIADLHIGHANVCKFTRDEGEPLRPWDDVDEMNEALIDNWNSIVREGDKVYVLGDFTVNKKYVHLGSRLNGRKILIAGNHDNATPQMYMDAGFEDVKGCHVLQKQGVIMTHIPVHTTQLDRFGGGNIHGHLHDKEVYYKLEELVDTGIGEMIHVSYNKDPKYLCVSVEQPHVNYKPLLLDEALNILRRNQE